MTKTMIEQVARALWEDWITNGKTTTEGARGLHWEQLVEGGKTRPKIQMVVDDAYSQARAAISAMRETTPDVREALEDANGVFGLVAWANAIDAALKETP